MANVFVDSTTLLYTIDPDEPLKAGRARAWLKTLMDSNALTLSVQVLNESYSVVWRKTRFTHARPTIRADLMNYAFWITAALDVGVVRQAWAIQDRFGIQFWDCLLVASANAARCSYFLSEDLNDGQAYGLVTAINPFRHAPEDVLGRAP